MFVNYNEDQEETMVSKLKKSKEVSVDSSDDNSEPEIRLGWIEETLFDKE